MALCMGDPQIGLWRILLAVGVAAFAVAAAVAYRRVREARRLAEAHYGDALDTPEPTWIKYGRRLRVTLLHVFLASFAVASFQAGASRQMYLGSPAVLAFLLAGLGALLLAALPRRPESEAARIERAHAVAMMTAPLSAKLAEDLVQRVRQLAEVTDLVRIRSEVAAVFRSRYAAELALAASESARVEGRRARRQQWLTVAVGFVLGFVVNWTSTPVWQAIVGLFR